LSWLHYHKIQTLRAEYVYKSTSNFVKNEIMRIRLIWLNEHNIDNLCLRIEILKLDRSPIGTSMLYDFYSGKQGEKGSVIVGLNINNIAPGKYTMNYTFFEKNTFGGNVDIDCVHGLYFDIEEDDKILWNEYSWGPVRLPDLVIEKE
jgi:hypothetical protein